MEELIFSCNWGNNPEKAWSGTSLGLYKELKKYYKVEDMNINPKTPILFPLRCLEKLELGRYDMQYMQYYNKVFCRRFAKKGKCKVFQMDECPNVEWADSYVFVDLSIGFLLDIYSNRPELIPYIGLENLSEKYLKKRLIPQNEFYHHAKGIFTMGAWLADFLVNSCGISRDKVHAVGGGMNVDISAIDDTKKEGNKFLFVGRNFSRKGGDLVVKAFSIVKEHCPEAELYIAGPKSNPIDAKDMTDGINFLGEQNKSELNELYNKCDIFCLPSRFEAYGLVFPEALAFGLPCIGRNDFSMKEFIKEGENGYLIDNDDVSALAQKMELALKNEAMKKYVKECRQQYIEEYSWENVVKKIVNVIGT